MSARQPVPVVGAVAVRDGRVFLARRPEGGRHAGLWEFPGGKVEPGETDVEALERELEEELQVRCAVGASVAVGQDGPVELRCYEVVFHGDPRPSVPQEVGWFDAAGLASLATPPADVPVVQAVLRRLGWR